MHYLIVLVTTYTILIGCDPEGKKQCAWFLEPEPSKENFATRGHIPVCARNRTTMKQDCRLQTTLDFAKQVYGKKFRYHDLKVHSVEIPRTVTSLTLCEGSKETLTPKPVRPQLLKSKG